MSRFSLGLLLNIAVAVGCTMPALAQATPTPLRQTIGAVKYQSVAEGVHEAQIFGADALSDVRVEVKDFIFGPGKSAPDIPVPGFVVTELKSGEVETTIGGQTMRRRPGDFWLVRPGLKYSIKNLGGMAVLHVIIFTRK